MQLELIDCQIFCLSNQVVSCSADGMIHYNDFDRRDLSCSFNCHVGAVYEVKMCLKFKYQLNNNYIKIINLN